MTNRLDILIYRPGVILPEPHTIELREVPSYGEINAAIGPLVCRPGTDIEHVSVLFRDAPHDMFVDELSASDGMPVNEAATLIYHENSRRRGDRMEGAPKIHGVACVALRRIWF